MTLKLKGSTSGYVALDAPSSAGDNTLTLPTTNGSADQLLKTDGSGNLSWTDDNSGVSLSGSTNNTIATVSGSNALVGEANLTFDGSTLALAGNMQFTAANAQIELNNGGPRFWSPSANTLTIHTGGGLGSSSNERLRIDSSGRLLKGITSARGNFANNTSGVQYAVQVEGTSGVEAGLSIIRNSNDINDGGIVLGKTRSTANGVATPTVVDAGDDLGTITWAGSDGTTLQFGAEITAQVESGVGNDDMPASLIFKTNGGTTSTSEKLRITSTGDISTGLWQDDTSQQVLINQSGQLMTKANTAGDKAIIVHKGGNQTNDRTFWVQVDGLVHSARGIDFSAQTSSSATGATTNSEVLDHYEEGTFTPTAKLTYNTGNSSVSTNSSSGQYVKIGRCVHFQGTINYTMTGSTGAYNMGAEGLPFTGNTEIIGGGTARDSSVGELFVLESVGSNDDEINVFRKYNNTSVPRTGGAVTISFAGWYYTA